MSHVSVHHAVIVGAGNAAITEVVIGDALPFASRLALAAVTMLVSGFAYAAGAALWRERGERLFLVVWHRTTGPHPVVPPLPPPRPKLESRSNHKHATKHHGNTPKDLP